MECFPEGFLETFHANGVFVIDTCDFAVSGNIETDQVVGVGAEVALLVHLLHGDEAEAGAIGCDHVLSGISLI